MLDCPSMPVIPYPLATREQLDRTAADIEALGRRCIAIDGDVRNQEDIDRLVALGLEQLGHIDVVVPNAGVWTVNALDALTEDEFRSVLDVHVLGVWRTVKAVTPHFAERKQGNVVFIASVNGREGGARFAHYITSKHAVIGFMRATANELAPHNVRCNAILPGPIDTDILNWQGCYDIMAGGEGLGTREHLENGGRASALLPGRRLLAPQAVSNAVLWLASDESYEVSGAKIQVDAGHLVMPGLNGAALAEMAEEAARA
jgi:NAD(P)-dependent dehydrogenase (short-subunit alcohol dehydrogenase family)